jgi:alpha-beta hydrolase superfamily lysophospholipase
MRSVAFAALAVAIACTACGEGVTPGPPGLAERCGSRYEGLRAETFWFRAGDGTRLAGATVGQGAATVILATEYPADQCHWLDYARVLRRAGFGVFLFDFRGLGESAEALKPREVNRYQSDVLGAVEEARRRSGGPMLLVGASLGGTAVMVAAPSIEPPVAAAVSLSGEADLESFFRGAGLSADAAVRRLHVPLLVMVSRGDRYVSVPEARRLIRRAATHDKRLYVLAGSYHGWDLLYTAPYRKRAGRILLRFLRAHS